MPLGVNDDAELSSSETTFCCAVGAVAEDGTAVKTIGTTVHQSGTQMTSRALKPSFTWERPPGEDFYTPLMQLTQKL